MIILENKRIVLRVIVDKKVKKCHLVSSTFLSDPPNMPKWCKNNQNMHKSAKLCIKFRSAYWVKPN